jgi:glycosyltransferase involved in cell wall biosynthesis
MVVKIKYSIIIPAYNASLYIEKCLNSILNQSYSDFEVIIVNDGSTDNTLHILNNYEKRYPNIIVLSQDNAGPGAARELALKHTTGKNIMFSDADDYWEKDFLTGINANIEKWNPDILEFGYRKVDSKGTIIGNHPMIAEQHIDEDCIKHYIRQNNTTNYLWNKVFAKNLFRDIEFPHLYAGEDAAVLLQLFSNANLYVSIPDIYYNYIMTPTSLCRLPFNKRKLDIIKSDNFMYTYLSKKHTDLCETFAYAVCARSAVLYCVLMLSKNEEKNQLKNVIFQQYKRYRLYIKNPKKAAESYSLQRKAIVFLFSISPNLCVVFYKIIKKIKENF